MSRIPRIARRLLLCLAALAAGLAGFWVLIPEYDRPDPREIWRYATDPLYVVNTPMAYQLLGIAMGAEDRELARHVELPRGAKIRLYAGDLPHARVLHWSEGGQLLVSQALKGRVSLLEPDRDGDGRADGTRVLLDGLRFPNGLAARAGWLYLAETTRIARIRFDETTGRTHGSLATVHELPDTNGHNLRPLRFGPDGWLYTAVGTACNACVEDDPRQGVILRLDPETGASEVVARGFRNVTDLGWHPQTGELYALEVGRDLAGDDFPPDELNRITQGGFYGFPFLHGDGVPDPELEAADPELARTAVGPVHAFTAHSTPLGMHFPARRRPDAPVEALVALHGSWNRSSRVGYEVLRLRFGADGRIREESFATGFDTGERVIGRPVHVTSGADGAIYLSDDFAGAVYRITRGED